MNERIRELRKKLNLTMEKFGDRLGVGKTAVSKIEKGSNSLTGQMFKSICREFNVSEEWLRTGNGEMFVSDTGSELDALVKKYSLSHGVYILIEKLVNSQPETQNAIVEFVKEAGSALSADGRLKAEEKAAEESSASG